MVQFASGVQGQNVGFYAPNVEITMGTAGQKHMPMSFNATLRKFRVALGSATATGAEVVTLKDTNGNTLATISVPAGSAEGAVFESNAVDESLSEGDNLEIETDGGNANAVESIVTPLFEVEFAEND